MTDTHNHRTRLHGPIDNGVQLDPSYSEPDDYPCPGCGAAIPARRSYCGPNCHPAYAAHRAGGHVPAWCAECGPAGRPARVCAHVPAN